MRKVLRFSEIEINKIDFTDQLNMRARKLLQNKRRKRDFSFSFFYKINTLWFALHKIISLLRVVKKSEVLHSGRVYYKPRARATSGEIFCYHIRRCVRNAPYKGEHRIFFLFLYTPSLPVTSKLWCSN